MSNTNEISAEEFDRLFDEGEEDILKYCDTDSVKVVQPNNETRRVNINMPVWLIEAIDNQASRLGANRQSYINMHLAEIVKHSA